MSRLGMASLATLTLGGVAASLNMRRTARLARQKRGNERSRDTMLSSYWPWDLTAAGSGLGLLGGVRDSGAEARDSALEALVLRASVTAYVWYTILRDVWFEGGLRLGWLVPYTHWNFLLLALYAPISLLSSCNAFFLGERTGGRGARTGRGRQLSQAGQLCRHLFPLVATGALTVDIGYFVFLHGPIAAGAKITGWQMTKAMDPSALCKHLLNSAWVIAELGLGRMEMPTKSAVGPLALNVVCACSLPLSPSCSLSTSPPRGVCELTCCVGRCAGLCVLQMLSLPSSTTNSEAAGCTARWPCPLGASLSRSPRSRSGRCLHSSRCGGTRQGTTPGGGRKTLARWRAGWVWGRLSKLRCSPRCSPRRSGT
jgi:hypothetical protein